MLVMEGQHYESFSGFWALFPLPNSFSQLSNASGCCPSRNSYCNVEHLEDDCEERVSTTVLWQFLFFVECPSISEWWKMERCCFIGTRIEIWTLVSVADNASAVFIFQLFETAPQMRMLHVQKNNRTSAAWIPRFSKLLVILIRAWWKNISQHQALEYFEGCTVFFFFLVAEGFVSHVFQRHNSGQLSAYDKNFRSWWSAPLSKRLK